MPRVSAVPRFDRSLLVVAVVATAYVAWLGAHWLPLPSSSLEISVYASHLWDLQTELAQSGHIPWWTSRFFNGSSQALPYAGDLAILPWAALAPWFGLVNAGRLVALLSIALGGITMLFCARRFVRSELGAVAASLAYLLHPFFLTRAAGAEHINVVVFAGLLPLGWLSFAKVLDDGRFTDVFACAATLVLLAWAQNKQLAVQLLFFAAFALYSTRRSGRWTETLRALVGLGALAGALSAFIVVPAMTEVKLLKWFEGDPLDAWQQAYSVQSIGALVHRASGEGNYFGIVLLAVVVVAMVRAKRRVDRGLFWLFVGLSAGAIILGHGTESVASATVRAFSSETETSGSWIATGLLATCVALGAAFASRKLATPGARGAVFVAVTALLLVPWFRVVEVLPLYGVIRAPEVFFQLPGAFFGALLAGFFVADVLEPRFESTPNRALAGVAALAALFVVDAWPFQGPMKQSDVLASTLDHARALYAGLGEEAKQAPGKVYVVTARCFHELGPSWGGPPLVTQSSLEYMAPRGTGRLTVAARESFPLRRAYLELEGVRWIVFDKSDPYAQASGTLAQLSTYRELLAVEREDDDFAVFRVPTARPFVSGYTHKALAYGDPHRLPELALALEGEGYLLVHADGERIEDATPARVADYAAVYVPSFPVGLLAGDVLKKVIVLREGQPFIPARQPRDEPLSDVTVVRPAAEEIHARFTASEGAVAVVGESYYPYWTATLDGQPARVLRVAYGLMGVDVAKGAHEVVLRYEPPRTYRWSAALSVATLLSALAVLGVGHLRRLRQLRAGPRENGTQ